MDLYGSESGVRCHSERSEESLYSERSEESNMKLRFFAMLRVIEILRFAQNDNKILRYAQNDNIIE